MKILELSNPTNVQPTEHIDNINLFGQFYIDANSNRQKEILKCLEYNVNNRHITKVYLLNERIYTDKELGIKNDEKIIQIVIGKRLTYGDVFKYINENSIIGYNILCNSDIFFDETIRNLYKSDIHLQKKMYSLLRYEYNPVHIHKSVIFGPRMDSQDSWIIHSNFNIPPSAVKIFNFNFGKLGCDNKMLYLLKILGYEILNDPLFIKSYHYHLTEIRNYTKTDAIPNPYAFVGPHGFEVSKYVDDYVNIPAKQICGMTNNFKVIAFEDNHILFNYISDRVALGKKFIIPRIAGIENIVAVAGVEMKGKKNSEIPSDLQKQIKERFIPVMKNNAGVKLSSNKSIVLYSDLYLKAFENCDLYCCWEFQGNVINQSNYYILNNYKKQLVWAFALDIFHYIYSRPWTLALQGKRILLISAFEDSLKEKIPIREKIYGIDLFPGCEFIIVKPPQTQGTEESLDFNYELEKFYRRLDEVKDSYDVALVSCGGYGNLVCNYIFENHNKSSIYVGGVLQMYFGILGNRWLKERPDVVRLFLNSNWSRPKDCEKPKNSGNIEGACYW